MDFLKEKYEQTVIFVKEHKPLVLLSVIFVVILGIILILVSAGSSSQPPATSSPDVSQPTEPQPTEPDPGSNQDLGGDGGDEGDDGQEEPDQTDEEVELNVWGAFINEEVFDEINANYDNPNITINYSNEIARNSEIPGYVNNLNDELDADLSSAPDIFIVKNTWAGNFSGLAASSSSETFSFADFSDTYPAYMQIDFTENEDVIGIPLWQDTPVVIYNNAIWDDAGETEPAASWTDFVDQLDSLPTEFDGQTIAKANITTDSFNNNEHWFSLYNNLITQSDLVDESGELNFSDTDSFTKITSLYNDMATASNWSSDYNIGVASFLEGKLATYIAPSWRLNEILVLNEAAGLDLDVEVAALPTITGETETSYGSFWGFMVNGDSDNIEAAWDYLNYLSDTTSAEDINSELSTDPNNEIGLIYPQTDLLDDQSQEQYLGIYSNQLQEAATWKMYSELEIEPIFQQYLEEDITLSELESQVNEILQN
jgi:ABC-type glycerol-3-phosphate transport system substrate-binding protein